VKLDQALVERQNLAHFIAQLFPLAGYQLVATLSETVVFGFKGN